MSVQERRPLDILPVAIILAPVAGDLDRALGALIRRRAFAVTAVLTLALAFSIPAVVLSTVDRHFWRPLDRADSDRLFTLQIRVEDGRFSPLSHPEYLQLRDAGAEASFSRPSGSSTSRSLPAALRRV